MFKTLFIKEIHETLNNSRSMVAALLCLLIIPLGIYINSQEYELRRDTWKESEKLYHDQTSGNLGSGTRAEGFRPPSPFGVFIRGMEDALPDKVITNRNGIYSFSKNTIRQDALTTLFGSMDFLYIVGTILSLLALIFTFNSVSGERESGTLKLVMSNTVPRGKYILAKITGPYMVFITCFVLSFITGFLILVMNRSVDMQEGRFWLTVFVILLLSAAYLFVMFALGTLASCLTKNSVSSIVITLFAWVILFAFVPKVSPLIARLVYPLPSQKAIEDEKHLAQKEIEKERDARRAEILEKIMFQNNVNPKEVRMMDQSPEQRRSFEEYDEQITPVETAYQDKILSTLEKIDRDYETKVRTQQSIAKNISRISPVSCYLFLITEISLTGLIENENFKKYGAVFQQKVDQEIYSKYTYRTYIFGDGNHWVMSGNKEGVQNDELQVPHLDYYEFMPLGKILLTSMPDLLLLLFYLILVSGITIILFAKYDVR